MELYHTHFYETKKVQQKLNLRGYPNFLGVSNLGGNLGDNKEK